MHEADDHFSRENRRTPRFRAYEGGAARGAELHSLEAEQSLLSAMVLDGAAVLAACEVAGVTAGAFFDPRHATIFAVGAGLWAKNIPVEAATLWEELRTRQLLDAAGGMEYFAVATGREIGADPRYWVGKVFELALLRAMQRDAQRVLEALQEYDGDLDGLVSTHAGKFQRLADYALRRHRRPQRAIGEGARAYAEAALAGKLDTTRRIPLGGLPHSTEMLKPFDVIDEQWLNFLSAPPGGGKSTLQRMHIGENLLTPGYAAAVFILEGSAERWILATAGQFVGISVRPEELVDIPVLFPEKAAVFLEWVAWLNSLLGERLWVFEDVFYLEDIIRHTSDIHRRVRERQVAEHVAAGRTPDEAQKLAHGLSQVAGDHLHLIATRMDEKFRGNSEAKLSHISGTLKRHYKALNISSLWTLQMSRAARVEGRRPTMADLRGSGTLEQDADTILFLHTPESNKAGNPQDGNLGTYECELIQAKRRNGPANLLTELFWHRKSGRFTEAARSNEVKPGMKKPAAGYKRPS